MKLFERFADEKLTLCAEHALSDMPNIAIRNLDVTSKKGTIILRGSVQSDAHKARALRAVQQALVHDGLKYKEIADELTVK